MIEILLTICMIIFAVNTLSTAYFSWRDRTLMRSWMSEREAAVGSITELRKQIEFYQTRYEALLKRTQPANLSHSNSEQVQ